MIEFLSALSIHLSRHPLVIALALAAVLRMTGTIRVDRPRSRRALDTAFAATGVAALVAYFGVVVFYAIGPQYFDAAEPTMTAVGWLFNVGRPIYHAVDSAERYSHIYGPMVFIVQGTALKLFGATIQVSKWVGCALALGALAMTFIALRTRATGWRALVLTGWCALLLLGFRNYSFWTRAEPLQIFCVAAGLACVHWRSRTIAAVLAGLLVGVLWNLKITGPAYSLPLFVLLFYRSGWQTAAGAAVVAAITAVIPFVVFSNVSFEAYLTWVRLSAKTGLLLATLRQNIEWAIYLAVPLVLGYFARRLEGRAKTEWAVTAAAVVAATCGVIVAGSKPGAGPYHLLPLLPIAAYLIAERFNGHEPAAVPGFHALATGFAVVAVSIAVTQQVQFLNTMMSRRNLDATGDIQRFATSHPGVIEMGYAINDPVTFQRPVLVFRNDSYFIDQPAVGEHLLAGINTPPATVAALRHCRVNYWLIPKSEKPFSGVNMYPAVRLQPLFSEAFRQAFFDTHALAGTTDYFDVWQCRAE